MRGLRAMLLRTMPRLLVLDSAPSNIVNPEVMLDLERVVAGLGCGVIATHRTHDLVGEPHDYIPRPGLTRWVLRGMTDDERAMRGLTPSEAAEWVAVEGPPLDGGSGVNSCLLPPSEQRAPSDSPVAFGVARRFRFHRNDRTTERRPKRGAERWLRRTQGGVLVP